MGKQKWLPNSRRARHLRSSSRSALRCPFAARGIRYGMAPCAGPLRGPWRALVWPAARRNPVRRGYAAKIEIAGRRVPKSLPTAHPSCTPSSVRSAETLARPATLAFRRPSERPSAQTCTGGQRREQTKSRVASVATDGACSASLPCSCVSDGRRAILLEHRAAGRRRDPAIRPAGDVARRVQCGHDGFEILCDGPRWSQGERFQQLQVLLRHEGPPSLRACLDSLASISQSQSVNACCT
jgi:hypothetical protein